MSQEYGIQRAAKGTLPTHKNKAILLSSQEKAASADCAIGPHVAQINVHSIQQREKSRSRYHRRVYTAVAVTRVPTKGSFSPLSIDSSEPPLTESFSKSTMFLWIHRNMHQYKKMKTVFKSHHTGEITTGDLLQVHQQPQMNIIKAIRGMDK